MTNLDRANYLWEEYISTDMEAYSRHPVEVQPNNG